MEPITRLEQLIHAIANDLSLDMEAITRLEKILLSILNKEASEIKPQTRLEMYLCYISGADVHIPKKPITRLEMFLAKIAGEDVEPPKPITRLEMLLEEWAEKPLDQLVTVTGNLPLILPNAVQKSIHSLTRYGLCTQDGTPTPDAPVDIVCNNGALKVRRQSGMPIAYQMVEWLKPAGSIPITGFKTKSTQEIETVFYREQRGASYLYSSDAATSGTTNTTAYLSTGAGNWRWDGKSYSIGVSVGIKFTSIQNKDGVWLNGTQYGYYTDAGDFVSTSDLRLSSGENTTVRIYSMTIREGETVTLDLVPVQRVTDNAYGFYDKVSGNFYTNTDVTFEVGPVIDDPIEIYTDGTPEVLTVSGKNLFDNATMLTTNPMANFNNVVYWGYRAGNASTAIKIPVKPNTTYTLSYVGGNRCMIGGFINDVPLGETEARACDFTIFIGESAVSPKTFTTPNNCNFVCCGLANDSGGTVTNIQLELGTAATVYEHYVQPQTASVPMLLSVDTVKDEWEAIHGPLTHKVGVTVFDGTESWTKSGSILYLDGIDALEATHDCLCTHFNGIATDASGSTNDIKVGTNSTSNVKWDRINIYASYASASDFKTILAAQYAAGTPVIVVYPLATETTEQTTPQHLVTHKGVNVVDSTANVSPVEAKIEYYSSEG